MCSGRAKRAPATAVHEVEGLFAIELTTTFDSEDDPFAIETEKAPSAVVRLNGRTIELPAAGLHRGAVVRIQDIQGVLNGYNELYVQASPPIAESGREHGLRVKFYAEKRLLVDHTAWSSHGAVISDSFGFEYRGELQEESHDH